MRALRRFLIRFGRSVTRRHDEERLREEIDAHLALQAAEHERAGLSPAEARRQALLKFGAVEAVKEKYRDEQRVPVLDSLGQDVRYAVRQLGRAPLFTLTATLTLALAIGANTAIFTLVDRVLLRPLPVERPHELVQFRLEGTFPGDNWGLGTSVSYPMYEELRDSTDAVFSRLAAKFDLALHIGARGQTERVAGELVSGTYFPFLGVQPALGRLFTPKDDRVPGAHPAAVLSYAYWQARFAGDPSVVGRDITINSHPFTIIGVTQRGFMGMNLTNAAQVFVPMMMKAEMTPGWSFLEDERARFAQVFARLRPGISLEQAQASLQPYFRARRQRELADPYFAGASDYTKRWFLNTRLTLAPGFQGYSGQRGELTQPLWLLMGMAGGVLLIACANVAGLLVARGMGRQREVAIRLTIGAGRWRLIQQLLIESGMLASLGALGGLLLASWGSTLLLTLLVDPETSVGVTTSPDARILAFTGCVTLATGALFGLVPAWQITRPSLAPALKDQSRGVVGAGQVRLRKALVVVQVALSVLLLIGSGLFVRSLRNLAAQDPGFVTTNLVSFEVEGASSGYSGARARQFYKALEERLSMLPGVSAVALTRNSLLRGEGWNSSMTVEGYAAEDGEDVRSYNNAVTPGYFETMGITLLSGRDFTPKDASTLDVRRDADLLDSLTVAIANQRFVDRYFEGRNPIGRHVGFGGDPGTPTPIEIVGVVANAKSTGMREEVQPQLFFPFLEDPDPMRATVHVRTTQSPETTFTQLRRALQEIAPALPRPRMATMEQQVERSLRSDRLVAGLSSVFAALAAVLAVLGLYGVMAYTVVRRTREIGIHMALGAVSGRVAWLFLREAAVLVLVGFAIALPTVWVLSRSVESQLYGVEPLDPTTIILAVLGMGVVAALGAFVPAARAARIQPLVALREE